MRPALSLGGIVLAAGLALPSASFCDGLGPDGTLSATLSGGARLIPLAVPERSYVSGQFQPGGVEQALDLIGPDGRRRDLARGSDGVQEFHLVMPPAGALRVTGAAGSAFSLRLTRVVPPGAQVAPPSVPRSPRIAALAETLARGGDSRAFWAEVAQQGTPLVEPDGDGLILTFLYRGAAQNVRLVGGPSNDHDWLERLGTSDVWLRSYRVGPDIRLSYRLAPDVPALPGPPRAQRMALLATVGPDPLNPRRWPEDRATASVYEGPAAPEQPGFPAPALPVEELRFASAILHNSRRVQIWRSPGFAPADPQALLLFVFDGPTAVRDWRLPGALQALVAAGRLPPLAAVFIDPIDSETRSAELPGNPAFSRAMAEELLPFAARHLGLTPAPARTVLAGASFGGIAAARIALDHPDHFGAAIALSGSFWWAPEGRGPQPLVWMAERALAAAQLPRLVLSAGSYETARPDEEGPPPDDIREASRQLYAVLRARGAEAAFLPHAGGHDGFVWRGELTEALLRLYGR
ncbi:alpha/beta hydrolase-fold protein [Rhodobacter capsulatus]|uniref:alpha/beta hydrolase-fold protein n=1 Tax=Rhodobacter capsulatus TaxID=1061 RepID=UPI0003FCD45F|nr:alpha/beta hydrolase-fold protein [Rhodobacter capsulatus]